MNPEGLAKLAVNYGLGIILSVGMACFFGWLLKYVLAQNEKRENRLSDLISKDIAANTKAINDHDDKSMAAIKNVEEANRRQRDEHEAHKKLLEEINQENDRRRDAQEKIIVALSSLTIVVNELNKKEVYYQKKRTA